ncbi:unnamed protein product [Caenorhabditis bovis]|uniref:SMP-30/Gluconolactonase/LRE-like region domain-containing protein n=1 Tax=Caenorhabditis bovis TaxID=2654633 RepID=A0A8S1F8S5_9PELO|nr:unnamed protein product [Caenorhabditis bovis]
MLYRLVVIFFLGFLIQYIFRTLLFFGVQKRIYNHRPGECRRVQGPEHGSEDISLVREKNLAFITSGIVYIPKNSSAINWKGQIFVYDVKKRDYEAIPVPIKGLDNSVDFHPHGISHFITKTGKIRLFVVVHSKKFEHSVMLLDFDEKSESLTHYRTIRDEKFTHLTNTLEILTGYQCGSLVYYDGKNSHTVLDNTIANGISLSSDGKTIFVSHINDAKIGVYSWNENKKSVELLSEAEAMSLCDNFHVDENGNVWSGCHPIMKDAVGHLGDTSNPNLIAPSQVLRFSFSKDYKSSKIVEVFADDGNFISASSIAVNFDNNRQLLIGSVARQLVHCDIKVPLNF